MTDGTIEIHRMRIDELEAVQALYAQQIDADGNPLTALTCNAQKHAWEMRRVRQKLLSEQRYLAYVAIVDGKIVGYSAAVLETQARLMAVDTVAVVDELWVLPEYRHRGIGRGLMETLCEGIRALGIDWVKAHFPEDATEARDFFAHRGFAQRTVEVQARLGADK